MRNLFLLILIGLLLFQNVFVMAEEVIYTSRSYTVGEKLLYNQVANHNQSKIAITDIFTYSKGQRKSIFLDSTNVINIKYSPVLALEIKFAALEHTDSSKNMYRVYVVNYDKDWRPETTYNSIMLPHLQPGNYLLKIMTSNNDLELSESTLEIPIIVKSPLWLSKYALALYILSFIFIIQLIINLRIKHYKNVAKSLKAQNKDQDILEAQKIELEKVNKNLTDSINYATRIQSAVIPAERRIRNIFPQSFVYFRPRDIVSGDFYWVSEMGNKVFLAVVDCTGHGVPGAFLSIIGINLLRNIIEGFKEENPARILETLSLELDKTFGNKDLEDTIKDGMDMALCVIDREKSTLEFAGAVNELYLIRDSELLTYKGDRSPIGHSVDGIVPKYSVTTIDILPNDMVYIFSDGYADQFGGSEIKKFKYRRFRYLLLNMHNFSPEYQRQALHQAFEEWRGENEQVDDVLVMGFCPIKVANSGKILN